jgi:Flp pilus assembly protein TadD
MSESLDRTRGHVSALDLRRYDEAARAARSGLAAQPDDPVLTLLLAVALCNNGDRRQALPVAGRAVALLPDNPVAHRTLGWALFMKSRDPKAADRLTHALSLDPHDPVTHAMRAEMLLTQAQRTNGTRRSYQPLAAEAEQHAAEVVRLTPAAPAGHLLHAKMCLLRVRCLATYGVRWHEIASFKAGGGDGPGRHCVISQQAGGFSVVAA